MNNIQYLIYLLQGYNLTLLDITTFLGILYNNIVLYDKQDLELVFSSIKYLDAYCQFSDLIDTLTINELKEYYNSI